MTINLKEKLITEFNIEIKSEILEVNQSPIMTLQFPDTSTSMIMRNLNRAGWDISKFAIWASSMARLNRLVLPVVDDLKANVISKKPYVINVQGVYAIIYCFAGLIIQER